MKRVFVLILLAGIIFGQNVKVSYSSCQDVLDLLKMMKNRSVKSQVEKKIDKLLSHKDYKVVFSFYKNNFSNNINKNIFKKMILSLRWPDEYRRGENHTADQMLVLWSRVYNNLPHLQHKINQLEKINLKALIKASVRRANQWLPPGMKAKTFNFIVTADGKTPGYQINSSQVYDIFQIPINQLGNIDKDLFSEIIAHESHHSGLKLRHTNKSEKHHLLSQFFSYFITEGTATKLVNNVYGKFVERINSNKPVPYFKAIPGINIEREWKKMFSEEPEMFSKFFNTAIKILDGSYKYNDIQKELNKYWIAPGSAKYYLIGSELIGAIYFGFGKNGCFDVMKDPIQLITLYNSSIKKNRYKLKNCPKVPKKLLNLL